MLKKNSKFWWDFLNTILWEYIDIIVGVLDL